MTLADDVLVVEPAAFGFNPEAAATNRFAHAPGGEALDGGRLAAAARSEVGALAAALRSSGVAVLLEQDTAEPRKPDAVFPNNWVSFHPDGTAVLYPMANPSRRLERRTDILARVAALHGTTRVVDLTWLEAEGEALEGTGSLVLDHDRRVAFTCRSPRATPRALAAFEREVGYEVVPFGAAYDGLPVYHTNVVLALGPDWALLAESLVHTGLARLRAALGPREILPLTEAQVRAFAGNVLVLGGGGSPRVVASRQAATALAPYRARLEPLVAVALPLIEAIGGGSARCMMAEIFRGTRGGQARR